MRLRPYYFLVIPILLWSMQTTTSSWFLDENRYSPAEVGLYRSLGAMLFALVVSRSDAYRQLDLKQFIPGLCLAANFFFFNYALKIAISNGDQQFGPLLMTIEASNFVFCLPILWIFRKPAQVSAIALLTYLLGMAGLLYGAKGGSKGHIEALLFAGLTSLTFGLFICTVDLVSRTKNRSIPSSTIPLMLPIFSVNLILVVAEYWFPPDSGSIPRDFKHVWSLQTLALLGLVGFVQTGTAYYFWTKAGQIYSPLKLALAFLWTVPIAYLVSFVPKPHFLQHANTAQLHQLQATDLFAIILLIGALYLDKKKIGWMIILRDRRTRDATLGKLDNILWQAGSNTFRTIEATAQVPLVKVEGKTLLNFASADYLGLGNWSISQGNGQKAIEKWGWGLASSRNVAGSQAVHGQAEAAFAKFLGGEEAILFPSAYAANLSAFEWLSNRSIILRDEASHGSILDGIRISKAEERWFRHRDLSHLEDQLNRPDVLDAETVVIATDGVFSATGEVARLKEIGALAKQYKCFLFVDDTHGTAVLGDNGAGTHELRDCIGDVDILVTSFGKALGCPHGGVLSGKKEIIKYVRRLGHSYHYSNAISPVVAEMALGALSMIQNKNTNLAQLRTNMAYIKSTMPEVGAIEHPMFGIHFAQSLNNQNAARFLFDELMEGGVFPALLSPPYTLQETYSVRLQITALHSRPHIEKLVDVLTGSLKKLTNSNLVSSSHNGPAWDKGWQF